MQHGSSTPAILWQISVKADEPVDTCDTAKLQISGLNTDVLSRIHCFVRLWRTLGWTAPEVDRTIQALAPDANTPALTNEILVRLDHLREVCSKLRLSVAQALALWRPIDTREPGSLYRSLFYNPAVFKPQDEDFRLRPDGQELARLDKQLAEHAPNLQAIFRLNFANFQLLLARTDGALTLSNLSLLYGHATLARQLGLSVNDLLTAIDLTGIDPFRIDRSQDTLQFIEIVKAIRSSGFDFSQLDYLLRHRFNPASAFVPADSMLASNLAEVRNGLLQVDADSEAERKALEQSAIIDRIAAALGMPADLTGGLLARVTHDGALASQRFSELLGISEPLTRDIARSQFETLEKLLKIATIIQALKIPASQLEWLFRENAWLAVAPDPPAAPVPFATWYTLIQLQQLRQDLALEEAAFEAILGGTNSVAVASDPQAQVEARKAFVSASPSGWAGRRRTSRPCWVIRMMQMILASSAPTSPMPIEASMLSYAWLVQ